MALNADNVIREVVVFKRASKYLILCYYYWYHDNCLFIDGIGVYLG